MASPIIALAVTSRIDRRDLPWAGLIAVSFIVGLVLSWQRWGNPLVDCGREMNQPLRLARGEMLYSAVRHIYGPLSPYVNATLYRIFGPSLNVLYADGIVTAILIIALVYWLSRQVMGRAPSAAAALSVMWLCAFKQAGNYILPYSYSALHACALGLVTLALLVRWVDTNVGEESRDSGQRRRVLSGRSALFAAGIAAGLTTLAKTEMGLAALATGVLCVGMAGYPRIGRSITRALVFLGPALGIAGAAYAFIAARVGWSTLSHDAFIFFLNLPPELVYFNRRMSGLDQPGESLFQMVLAALRILSVAGFIAGLSMLAVRVKKAGANVQPVTAEPAVSDAGNSTVQIVMLLAVSVLVFVGIPLVGMQWEKGPYLAMPILLVVMIAVGSHRYQKGISRGGGADTQTLMLVLMAIYALLNLLRVILRVRSGGAYSSYLLPASVILFTYCCTGPFPDLLGEARRRRFARGFVLAVIFTWVLVTAGVIGFRYRNSNTHPIRTARGTIVAQPDLGQSVDEAMEFISRATLPTEPVAVMPEGTSLNFFTDRPNPLREEITTPGYLDEAGEQRAIESLIASNTRLVLVTNRATPEFGAAVFGRDYCRRLMGWIEENYEPQLVFGPNKSRDLQIGDTTFFIRAYVRKELPSPQARAGAARW
ncbi:MAG TPA: hypothetical protein VJH03_25110 [Blastocatellia bacterium]|nr:hypothetical protein [Blastocatellia bacterium]